MTYTHTTEGIFLSRPNRFIAYVSLNGRQIVCHVKNTGRCKELLIPGVRVILEYFPEAAAMGRKTEYDLIAVYKGELLINMDSQAPNKAAFEWLAGMSADVYSDHCFISPTEKGPGFKYAVPFSPGSAQLTGLRREVTHGDSRFDLAFLLDGISSFMEVKGVTLEANGQVRFPDAPTERGVKHVRGLIRARSEGFHSFILFVIQMKGVTFFSPNDATHPAFGEALREAAAAGVKILAYDCVVTPDSMRIDGAVPVVLQELQDVSQSLNTL